MTYSKIASFLFALSCSAIAQAETSTTGALTLSIDSQGPIITVPLTLGDGRTIQNDWFSFVISVTNNSNEGVVIPIRNIEANFEQAVGSCQSVADIPFDSVTLEPGVTLKTGTLYCGGLKTGSSYQHAGLLSVQGTEVTSQTPVTASIPLTTN